jgi:NAD(P)H dehydrogenase (quinone)
MTTPTPKSLVLVTAAGGSTGLETVRALLALGHPVRALVRTDDHRAQALRDLGVSVVFGSLDSLRDVRLALASVQAAYFCYPLAEGLVEAAVIFAQAAKEAGVSYIANMSHRQSAPAPRSKATQNHWLSERVFDMSGVPTVHLRPTVFSDWLLYIAPLIQYGRFVMTFAPEARYAPISPADIACMTAALISTQSHAGEALLMHGAKEYSQVELCALVSRILGRPLTYEQVTPSQFLDLLGMKDEAKLRHFQAMALDVQEGLCRGEGVGEVGRQLMGRELETLESFIEQNKAKFSRKSTPHN